MAWTTYSFDVTVNTSDVSVSFYPRLCCQLWRMCPWSSIAPLQPLAVITGGCLRGSTFRAHAPFFRPASRLEWRWGRMLCIQGKKDCAFHCITKIYCSEIKRVYNAFKLFVSDRNWSSLAVPVWCLKGQTLRMEERICRMPRSPLTTTQRLRLNKRR